MCFAPPLLCLNTRLSSSIILRCHMLWSVLACGWSCTHWTTKKCLLNNYLSLWLFQATQLFSSMSVCQTTYIEALLCFMFQLELKAMSPLSQLRINPNIDNKSKIFKIISKADMQKLEILREISQDSWAQTDKTCFIVCGTKQALREHGSGSAEKQIFLLILLPTPYGFHPHTTVIWEGDTSFLSF